MDKKPVSYENTTYNSLNEACRNLSLPYTVMIGIMRRTNFKFEDAVNYYLNDYKNENRGKSIIYKNKTYKSVKDLCSAFHLSEKSVYRYKHRHEGCSYKDAVDHFLNKKNVTKKKFSSAHRIEINGESFESKSAAIRHFNLNVSQINGYLYRNPELKLEDAIKEYLRRENRNIPKVLVTQKTTEVKKNINDDIQHDLEIWRAASKKGKYLLVNVENESDFLKLFDDLKQKAAVAQEIYPDKNNLPWLKFDSLLELCKKSDTDLLEVCYLTYLKEYPVMQVINICREDLKFDVTDLKERIRCLQNELRHLCCEHCGEVITPDFRKLHPDTHYCVNCYDQFNA